jgi:AraC-like DNA-binding protein
MLRITQLASDLNMSQRHFLRGFKTAYGIGPKHFARLLRIEQEVEARLRGAGWTEIAHDSGFSDEAHLSHDFNAVMGMAPEDVFRAQCAGRKTIAFGPLFPSSALCTSIA